MNSPVSLRNRVVALGLQAIRKTRVRLRHESDRRRVRPRLEGLEDRCLLSGISGYTQYPIPSGNGAWYITTGADGNLWFTEGNVGQVHSVGMINPTTHAVSEFPTPTANSYPREITSGPDGNIWFTEFTANKLAMINPSTRAITEYSIPFGSQPWGITTGPDGNIWFAQHGGNTTTSSAIGSFDPTTHVFHSYPTYLGNGNYIGVGPFGITTGPDGNLWFATYAGGVGSINPTTHVINEFAIPGNQPNAQDITAGSDGNLWFSVYASNDGASIGSINPTTHAINLLATSTTGITSGPDGNIWFGNGQLGQVHPTTDALTQFPISASRGITTGPDGNLWLAAPPGSITVATLSPTETNLVVNQQPPSSITAGSPFGLTVTAEDGAGNVLSSFNGNVTLALANNPSGATLGGTLTATAVNGVATFSGLTLNKASAGYTLLATSGLSGEGFTSAINVTPAAASQLVITAQPPATVKVSTAFGLQASIEDAYGNVVTIASNTVSVAFANNPTGATLGGTLSVTANQGVATFANLTINKTGTGYTLKVSSSGLSSTVTGTINVTKTGKTPVPLAAPAAAVVTESLLGPLVFDSPDLWTGLGRKKNARTS
jgi:streptogramin lyase